VPGLTCGNYTACAAGRRNWGVHLPGHQVHSGHRELIADSMAVKATIFWGKLAVSHFQGSGTGQPRPLVVRLTQPVLGHYLSAVAPEPQPQVCVACCDCVAVPAAAAVSRLDPGTAPPALVARCRTAAARLHPGDCVGSEVGLGVEAEIAGAMIESCGSAGQDVPS